MPISALRRNENFYIRPQFMLPLLSVSSIRIDLEDIKVFWVNYSDTCTSQV